MDGQNLLQACLSLGFDVPYFCWHPALHSVGSCRMCAVKQFRDESDTRGRIVMSCMTPAASGTRISIDDPEIRKFRAGMIELLMANHPHDCPVCDEGGECHLQDMTVMSGHVYRAFRFKKRTHKNQRLGPFINHEMNRCIQCYRCVRFYREYAGGRDLNVFASHHHVYFGRYEDGVLENEFSGNLVEVCPTGVFTDKTLKQHYTRKWDMQTAPSVCVHCGTGCNTIPGERFGQLRRILNRYNKRVNGYFICDRGRFGYEFVNSGKRLRSPLLRLSGSSESKPGSPVVKEDVFRHIKDFIYFGAKVIGIGSPRASLEANYALRTLVGPERFYSGLSDKDQRMVSLVTEILGKGPACSASLSDVRESDAVLVLGEDVTNTAPMLSLAIRRSIRQKPLETVRKMRIPEWQNDAVNEAMQQDKGPLFVAAPYSTRLEDAATATFYAAPEDIARLGFAVAHEIDLKSPPVKGVSKKTRTLAAVIAKALKEAKRPLIVSGTGCGSEDVIRAAANVAWALCESGPEAALYFSMPECNSMGAGLMSGKSVQEAFGSLQKEAADTLVILENDLYRRADSGPVNKFLESFKHVIAIDHLMTETVSKADAALPAGTFAEADGTLVNNECRPQRFFQVFVPDGDVQESWRWLRDMMINIGHFEADTWGSLDDIISAMIAELPTLGPVMNIAPSADFRMSGRKIPRQPHRYSGRTAMLADISVHEPKPPEDPDSALAFSMEGHGGQPPAALIPRYWAPLWNSVQALNKYQKEIGGFLKEEGPDIKLIVADKAVKADYFHEVPEAFENRSDQGIFLIVPVHHIFGSEELSAHTPGIAERSPRPYLALNKEDAGRLGIKEGDEVEFSINGETHRFPVRLLSSLPSGVAGLPAGIQGLQGISLPGWSPVSSIVKRPEMKKE